MFRIQQNESLDYQLDLGVCGAIAMGPASMFCSFCNGRIADIEELCCWCRGNIAKGVGSQKSRQESGILKICYGSARLFFGIIYRADRVYRAVLASVILINDRPCGLTYAPSLLPLKRPCFLSRPGRAISNPKFGVYIIHI